MALKLYKSDQDLESPREIHLFALINNYEVLGIHSRMLPKAAPKAKPKANSAALEVVYQQYCHL